jgi:hypothetical protein
MIVNKPDSATTTPTTSSAASFNNDSRYETPLSPLGGSEYRAPFGPPPSMTRNGYGSRDDENLDRVNIVEEDGHGGMGAPPAYSAEPEPRRYVTRRDEDYCVPVL